MASAASPGTLNDFDLDGELRATKSKKSIILNVYIKLNSLYHFIDISFHKSSLPLLFLEPLGDDVPWDSNALPPASDVLLGIIDLFGDALEDMALDDFLTVEEDTEVALEVPPIKDAFLVVTSDVIVE